MIINRNNKQIETATISIHEIYWSWIELKFLYLPLPRNRRKGFTIATKRSSDIATNVNTETPVEKSFINSDIIHIPVPHGHDSTVYTTDTNGTAVNINIKSAMDNDKMCLKSREKIENIINRKIPCNAHEHNQTKREK